MKSPANSCSTITSSLCCVYRRHPSGPSCDGRRAVDTLPCPLVLPLPRRGADGWIGVFGYAHGGIVLWIDAGWISSSSVTVDIYVSQNVQRLFELRFGYLDSSTWSVFTIHGVQKIVTIRFFILAVSAWKLVFFDPTSSELCVRCMWTLWAYNILTVAYSFSV